MHWSLNCCQCLDDSSDEQKPAFCMLRRSLAAVLLQKSILPERLSAPLCSTTGGIGNCRLTAQAGRCTQVIRAYHHNQQLWLVLHVELPMLQAPHQMCRLIPCSHHEGL